MHSACSLAADSIIQKPLDCERYRHYQQSVRTESFAEVDQNLFSPPESPSVSTTSSQTQSLPIYFASDIRSIRPRASSNLVSAPPELSFISECSQEPSATFSERDYYSDVQLITDLPINDLDDGLHIMERGKLGMSRASRESSFEPDTVQAEVESLLVNVPRFAVPKSSSDRRSISLSPTPSPPPTPTAEASQSSSVDTSSLRQIRRRNSGLLPTPPKDLVQRKTSVSTKEEQVISDKAKGPTPQANVSISSIANIAPHRKRSRPSLLDDLSMSPGHLSLAEQRLDRKKASSTKLAEQESPELYPGTMSGPNLGKTVRPSSSSEQIKVVSRTAAISHNSYARLPLSGPKRRASLTLPIMESIIDEALQPACTGHRKRSLTSAMQARPSNAALVSLSGQTQDLPSQEIETQATASRPRKSRSSSGTHKRTESHAATISINPSVQTVAYIPAAPLLVNKSKGEERTDFASRSRSTTPDFEPPASLSRVLQDIPVSHVQQGQICFKSGKGKGKLQEGENSQDPLPVAKLSSATLGNGSSNELIRAGAVTLPPRLGSPSQSVSRSRRSSSIGQSDLRESDSIEASPATQARAMQREGRRARTAVNYQEPSLAK